MESRAVFFFCGPCSFSKKFALLFFGISICLGSQGKVLNELFWVGFDTGFDGNPGSHISDQKKHRNQRLRKGLFSCQAVGVSQA